MNLKQIFTWWHKQTLGTLLKTLFFGKFVGKDSQGNKYYKSKKDERWIVYQDNIEAFLDAIDHKYGSIKRYLTEALGLSQNDLDSMRKQFLDD